VGEDGVVTSDLEDVVRAALAPTSVSTDERDGLAVATVGTPAARRQVLAFMGIDAWLEPFELQRFALLAAMWDAQVTIVDAPGCGSGARRLTTAERLALLRGDFTAVVRRMVAVARAHHRPLGEAPVLLLGYSMGASMAAAAAADPRLVETAGMVLVEPVGIRQWNLLSLLRSLFVEGRVIDRYMDNNDAFPDAVPPVVRRGDSVPYRSRRDLAELGLAVGRGKLMGDMLRAKVIHDFDVQVVHGRRSWLSPAADVEDFVAGCRSAGIVAHDVPVRGHHALWQSLPDVAELARLTGARFAR
jgi:pimeloyl-ACP methyl ester carboxylesterase